MQTKIGRVVLNTILAVIFIFGIALHAHAMGDFDEEKKPVLPSPEQLKKKREIEKDAFKESIKKAIDGIKVNMNFEKSGQFDSNFTTSAAMFAATELLSLSNSNVIDPMTAREMQWYARYNIEALTLQSGMGIHLDYSKMMEKEPLDSRINNIAKRTGISSIPHGIYPIFVEFSSGAPFYVTEPNLNDFKTLRWNKSKFRQEILPASLGLSIAAKTMLSKNLFKSHTGDLLGANPEDGFLGGILTLSAVSELDAVSNLLAYDGERLGRIDSRTYNPETGLKYFPKRINVKFEKDGDPQKPLEYSVQDAGASLYGQSALIYGISEFYHYSDPSVKDGWDRVFGEEKSGALFSLEAHRTAKDLLEVLFKNIVFMHFDKENSTFVSDYDKGKRGTTIFTDDFCMTMIGLSNLYRVLPEGDKIKGDVKKYIVLQADFARDKLQDKEGAFHAGYDLSKNKVIPTRRFNLADQASGMRGLIEAYRVTGNKTYLEAAKKSFDLIEKRLWDKDKGIYLSSEGTRANIYIPYTTAALFTSLAGLAQEGTNEAKNRISFAYKVIKILQLAELSPTGETFFTNEDIARMIETEGDRLFELKGDERAKGIDVILRKVADTDRDFVVKPVYAGGKFGGAPVFINQGTISPAIE